MAPKRFVLNRRRPDMTVEAFRRYWQHQHAPLLTGIREYRRYVRRYVQNHIVEQAPFGRALACDGITEIWPTELPPEAGTFGETEAYRAQVMPDEARLVDRARTIVFQCEEEGGPPKVGRKLMLFAEPHAADVTRLIGVLHRPVVNRVIDGSLRTLSGEPPDLAVALVVEARFEDEAQCRAACRQLAAQDEHKRWACVAVDELDLLDPPAP
jgi:hypothetical protein